HFGQFSLIIFFVHIDEPGKLIAQYVTAVHNFMIDFEAFLIVADDERAVTHFAADEIFFNPCKNHQPKNHGDACMPQQISTRHLDEIFVGVHVVGYKKQTDDDTPDEAGDECSVDFAQS